MNRVGLIISLVWLTTVSGPAVAGSTPPNGVSFAGVIGEGCSRTLPDGRLFAEHVHRLRAGQQVGVNVRSRDFAPIVEIAKRGSEARPLSIIAGASNALASGVVLRVPEDGVYVFRVSAADPSAGGRYRLEINHSDRIDQSFPGEDADLSRQHAGCAPLIMGR